MRGSMDPVTDNRVRYEASDAGGHVESHFLRANSPDGERAIWIKHTLLAPVGRAGVGVGEAWAVAFERRRRRVGVKSTVPIGDVRFSASPFRVETGEATLETGRARGTAESGGHCIRWDLSFDPSGPPHHPFPLQRMYEAPFPKQKLVTPYPDVRFDGTVEVDGTDWRIDRWPGMQGHNWGRGHTHAYAWAHGNAWDEGADGPAWFEGFSGRVKMGPVVIPWVSMAAVHVDGRTHRFDRLRAMTARAVEVGWYHWRATLVQGGARLRVAIEADRDDIAGLRYENPDGSTTHCLNSKLARGTLVLTLPGEPARVLRSDKLALELGTKDPEHGVPMLV